MHASLEICIELVNCVHEHKNVLFPKFAQVKWCRENYHHDLGCSYSLRLASADTTGHIIVWDVSQGISLSEFSDGSKPVLDLHWLWTQDASHDLLAALHAPSSLVLWNADTGIKLWKKTFQESLICFAFDPFSPAKVTRTCHDGYICR